MNAPEFDTEEEATWFKMQLARAKRYRQLLAARRAGKSGIVFDVPNGSKRVLIDDYTMTPADRTALVELQNFAWKVQADAKLEQYKLLAEYHALKGS